MFKIYKMKTMKNKFTLNGRNNSLTAFIISFFTIIFFHSNAQFVNQVEYVSLFGSWNYGFGSNVDCSNFLNKSN
ncbi:MAG: hypothetical protein KDE33_18420 [Bacteroidetes bacterium]|nr:hypothetical protein [Bacteroidota bacterium]